MIQAIITKAEREKAPAPWPEATYDQRMVNLMRSKGLRFGYKVDPKPTELLQPWRAYEDFDSGDITIEQG